MMNWLVNNYEIIVVLAIVIAIGIYELYTFIKLPDGKKKDRIINWLIYACALAEKAYGSKTGQLKIKSVWIEFISAFPIVSKLITYERFSELVDEALVKMKEMLANNKNISDIIVGTTEETK